MALLLLLSRLCMSMSLEFLLSTLAYFSRSCRSARCPKHVHYKCVCHLCADNSRSLQTCRGALACVGECWFVVLRCCACYASTRCLEAHATCCNCPSTERQCQPVLSYDTSSQPRQAESQVKGLSRLEHCPEAVKHLQGNRLGIHN